jgi:saccharopine dehydrogenase (NAD+, L-lysine-forming)
MREPAEATALSSRVEQAGVRFVVHAGLVPGVPAALVRGAAEQLDRVRDVTVGVLFRDRDITYGSAIDMVSATALPSTLFENGSWRHARLTETRSIDFGDPYGACACYPMNLPELTSLSDQLRFERAVAYAAGLNPRANAIAAVWFLLKLARIPSAARLGARLFMRAAQRTPPPFGVVVAVELSGERAGQERQIRQVLRHADGYIATAIPAVSCIFQVLDGTISTGLGMMGHVVDPERLVRDMERLGMAVRRD